MMNFNSLLGPFALNYDGAAFPAKRIKIENS